MREKAKRHRENGKGYGWQFMGKLLRGGAICFAGCMLFLSDAVGSAIDLHNSQVIARAMREIQARYRAAVGVSWEWPSNAQGQAAPDFPDDFFYNETVRDISKTRELVQSMQDAFRQPGGLEVEDFYRVDSVQALETVEGKLPVYQPGDFPFYSATVTGENAMVLALSFLRALPKLQFLRVPVAREGIASTVRKSETLTQT